MFVQKLSQVTEQLRVRPGKNTSNIVSYGIGLWCNQLDISQDINSYILKHYEQANLQLIIDYLWSEWQPIKGDKDIFGRITTPSSTSKLKNLVTIILNQIPMRSGNIEFFALITFVLTAVGYWLYILNQPTKLSNPIEIPKNYAVNPPAPLIPKINTQFLVLVVAAEKADLIHSIKTKEPIDGKKLYEITKYLWLGSEYDFHQRISNILDYQVAKNKESEFDKCLVSLELKQSDEGFKPNVNQLARYDAFRKLADLTVSFDISPRLQTEAYNNFEVYNR